MATYRSAYMNKEVSNCSNSICIWPIENGIRAGLLRMYSACNHYRHCDNGIRPIGFSMLLKSILIDIVLFSRNKNACSAKIDLNVVRVRFYRTLRIIPSLAFSLIAMHQSHRFPKYLSPPFVRIHNLRCVIKLVGRMCTGA